MENFGFPILRNFFISGKHFELFKTMDVDAIYNNTDDTFSLFFNNSLINSFYVNKKWQIYHLND